MTGFVEVLTTAFVLQLLALPGEKGQMVIAGLATKYNPYVVVAGAATAFGGWTVLEIVLGNALKGALPEMYLDAITVGLFVIFAVWILHSAPGNENSSDSKKSAETDGGIQVFDGVTDAVPSQYQGFVPSFSLMVFGEFGDKTQLITISLAVQYGAHPGIWLGEMLAIIPVSLMTALFFHKTAHLDIINDRWFHRLAAGLFLLFGLDITAGYVLGFSVLPI
ncbi:MAG: TMEM165/GDT1 family protein [Halodesulfurarchaeum sp.]